MPCCVYKKRNSIQTVIIMFFFVTVYNVKEDVNIRYAVQNVCAIEWPLNLLRLMGTTLLLKKINCSQ